MDVLVENMASAKLGDTIVKPENLAPEFSFMDLIRFGECMYWQGADTAYRGWPLKAGKAMQDFIREKYGFDAYERLHVPGVND